LTRRQFLVLILPLLAVLVGFAVLMAVEHEGPPGAPPWDADFLRYVRAKMGRDFVWGTTDEKRAREAYFNALNEYVRTFDGYAEVVPPWAVAESREESSGQYFGIGIRIDAQRPPDGRPRESLQIIGVKPGGPADDAGVEVGDRIVAIEGTALTELEADLETVIRGPEGTTVRLRIRREDQLLEVDVERARIDIGSVFGMRFLDEERRIGYVRIGKFEASTARDLRAKIEELMEQGLKALVLDLRHNPGGLLEPALEIADLFLPAGIIMRQRGRTEDSTATYRASADKTISAAMPLAVLINRHSASASEILAGALQDHRRAVIVGERSWGKFLVQIVEAVETDFGTALFKRTTSVYETPLGHHYQRAPDAKGIDPLAGILPDVFVPLADETLVKLHAVFEYEWMADWNPEGEPPHREQVDPHVAAAVAVLRGEIYYPEMPPRPKE